MLKTRFTFIPDVFTQIRDGTCKLKQGRVTQESDLLLLKLITDIVSLFPGLNNKI